MILKTPPWKFYEEQIYESLKGKVAPDATVTFDEDGKQKLPGRFSKIRRQIDVIVRGKFANLDGEHLMVVDCKCINTNVDVKEVEAFIGLVEDVGSAFGLLVTTLGFSQAAKDRAAGARGILLDVVKLDDLKYWLSQRPTVSYTVGAKFGYLTFFDGSAFQSREVDREFAEQLVSEMVKQEDGSKNILPAQVLVAPRKGP